MPLKTYPIAAPPIAVKNVRAQLFVVSSNGLVTSCSLPSAVFTDEVSEYLTRRERVLGSAAHLVELDLLRGGRPMPSANRPDCHDSALVSRVEDRPRKGFWPIGLRERLPEVPIPLRRPDGDARIDLQEVLHRVYDAYGYEDFLYGTPPEPPLSPEDAGWARQFITGVVTPKGKRLGCPAGCRRGYRRVPFGVVLLKANDSGSFGPPRGSSALSVDWTL
jgi:hypothetical protein